MPAPLERWYPYITSVIVTIVYFYFHRFIDIPSNARDLFPVVISISAIAVGFLMTAKSILLSIDQRRVIKGLKQGGVYADLVGYLVSAVNWSFGTTIVTALGMLLNLHQKPGGWVFYFYTGAWVFITATATVCCLRVIRIFSKILKQIAQEKAA